MSTTSAPDMTAQVHGDDCLTRLAAIVSADGITVDEAQRSYFAWDIASRGDAMPSAIVKPRSVEELRQVVIAASEARRAMVPRGGGHSYTGGYHAPDARAILLDLRGLDRIETISTADRYVVVEAGCTWSALYQALAAQGWRTPFFGPLSGIAATIGGALSQHAAFFGSANHGASGSSVLGLEVVFANGSLLRTGSWAVQDGTPFQRACGPDLTAIFLGDCGALGIKARIAMSIEPMPRTAFASFALADGAALVGAQVALAGLPGLAECFGFDPVTNENLTRGGFTLREKAEAFRDVAGATGGWRGMAAAVGLGIHRTAFLAEAGYTLHLVADGPDDAAAVTTIEAARQIMSDHPARELPDSVPRATRATPFRPIKALLGPDGERWLPVHALCPLSRAREALAKIENVLAARQADTARHAIRVSWLTSLVGNAFLIEPQLFWRDELTPFHERHVTDEQRRRYGAQKADPAARAVAFEMRRELTEVLDGLGAAHFQIGRYYDYAGRLSPAARDVLLALKAAFDPHNLMNPGALGLTTSQHE